MEPLLILFIAGVISLVKWISERKSAEATKSPDNPLARRREAMRRGATTSEEDRARRFMEALGIPTDGIPPVIPKTPPRPTAAAPKPVPQPLPKEEMPPLLREEPKPSFPQPGPSPWKGLPKTPPPAEPVAPESAAPTPQTRRAPLSTPAPMPTPRPAMAYKPVRPEWNPPPISADVDETAPPMTLEPATPKRDTAPTGSLRSLLQDRDAVRRAVILREVLDPPKGLRP